MRINIYRDASKPSQLEYGGIISIHVLPSFNIGITSYYHGISFSWIIWTIELVLWDENDEQDEE